MTHTCLRLSHSGMEENKAFSINLLVSVLVICRFLPFATDVEAYMAFIRRHSGQRGSCVLHPNLAPTPSLSSGRGCSLCFLFSLLHCSCCNFTHEEECLVCFSVPCTLRLGKGLYQNLVSNCRKTFCSSVLYGWLFRAFSQR